MIDIGANLANTSFDNDIGQVIQRARLKDIQAVIVTGTDIGGSIAACKLAEQHPGFLYATAGVHPHSADDYNAQTESELLKLLAQKPVVAIGEMGLDFNRNYSVQDKQIAAFEAQLKLASEVDKPLFLHERDAFKTFNEIMITHRDCYKKAVVHCFTGELHALKAYLDLGLFIGITGWICDKKRGAILRDIIRYAPVDRLMIETDSPYLTPHRDKLKKQLVERQRNEPWTLIYTAEMLSESMRIDRDILIEATVSNTRSFFNLD